MEPLSIYQAGIAVFSSSPDADLVGLVDALPLGHQLRHELRHLVADALRDQVANLVGDVLQHLKEEEEEALLASGDILYSVALSLRLWRRSRKSSLPARGDTRTGRTPSSLLAGTED